MNILCYNCLHYFLKGKQWYQLEAGQSLASISRPLRFQPQHVSFTTCMHGLRIHARHRDETQEPLNWIKVPPPSSSGAHYWVPTCFAMCININIKHSSRLFIHHCVYQSYRVCHGFRFMTQDYYFRVNLDYFLSELCFFRQLGQYQNWLEPKTWPP